MLNKILKGIIAFVLLSMLYGVFIGMTNKSDKIITELEIEASPATVYDFITDHEKAKEWLTTMKSIKRLSGEENEVGTQYEVIFDEGKNDVVMIETLTDVIENEKYSFDFTNDIMNGSVDIELTKSPNGTLVKETNIYSGNNFMARAMTGLFKGSIKKSKKEMYGKLKEAAESAAN